jgi:hypothetical protein
MAEYRATAEQTVNPGESVVFTTNDFPCTRGFVNHRAETGNFLLSGRVKPSQGCCCNRIRSADYLVTFGANIAIPTGGTVGTISLAIAVDGATIPASQMDETPGAVEEYNNVSRAINVPIWRNCCQTVTVRNVSDQPILVKNATIQFTRPDLAVTY